MPTQSRAGQGGAQSQGLIPGCPHEQAVGLRLDAELAAPGQEQQFRPRATDLLTKACSSQEEAKSFLYVECVDL